MQRLLKISEAGSLALHTAVLLAASGDTPRAVGQIAEVLHASENHLSKVLQRLVRAGIVTSLRGPKGGFRLAKPGTECTLLDVYEAIEGPLPTEGCLFNSSVCHNGDCILGGLLDDINRKVRSCLAGTRLSSAVKAYKH